MLFDTDGSKTKFNFIELIFKFALQGTATKTIPAAEELMERVQLRLLKRWSALKVSQFLKSKKLAHPRAWNWAYPPEFRSSSGRWTYVMRNSRTEDLFVHLLFDRNFPVSLINSARFLQLVLDNSKRKAQVLYEMSVRTAFLEQIYCHEMVSVGRELSRKKLNIVQGPVNTTLGSVGGQLVEKTRNVLTKFCCLRPLRAVI